MRNLTKDSRLTSRAYQFSKLIEAGYLQETYKGVDFFTKDEGKYFTLKVFHGTAANHTEYMNYRTAERRAEIINNYKANYDSRQTYKAEQKIKNKGKLSSHAAAAAAIKAELTSLYPHIKFSVKSDSFSMGDSVHVNWTDGPTDEEVNNVIKKYQYGSYTDLGDCFSEAERKTGVKVGLIKIQKAGTSYKTEFEGFFMDEEPEEQGENGIMSYNVVRDLVNRYVAAIKLYDKQLNLATQMNDLTHDYFFAGQPEFTMSVNVLTVAVKRAEFKKDMQKAGWVIGFGLFRERVKCAYHLR